jgi:RNA polymerase sigma-70 factor (ECF subfamily)
LLTSSSLEAQPERPDIPFYLWVRFLTLRRLQDVHRLHIGTEMRAVQREISLQPGAAFQATSE